MTAQPTRRRLADGREILYFDDRDPRPREAVDERGDLAVQTSTQLRFDPLRREWAVLAAHRQARTFLPPADLCPLCPTRVSSGGGTERHTEVPEASYDVVVFENRFASLAGTGAAPVTPPPDTAAGEAVCADGTGRCEVVVPTDDHDRTLADLPARRVRTLVDAWAQRSAELGARPDVAAVAVFENRGEAVGVTLSHTHQQVYAYPFVPPVTAQLAAAARRHRERTGGCLVCERLAFERAAGTRVVAAGEHWTVVVPYAARWPFEVDVVPHRHVRGLPDLDDAERDELARLWRDLFRGYDALFPGGPLPTMAGWHQTPRDEPDGHLYGQAFSLQRDAGKLKYLAGSESVFGAWILDVAPERAAEALRAATAGATAAAGAAPAGPPAPAPAPIAPTAPCAPTPPTTRRREST